MKANYAYGLEPLPDNVIGHGVGLVIKVYDEEGVPHSCSPLLPDEMRRMADAILKLADDADAHLGQPKIVWSGYATRGDHPSSLADGTVVVPA